MFIVESKIPKQYDRERGLPAPTMYTFTVYRCMGVKNCDSYVFVIQE